MFPLDSLDIQVVENTVAEKEFSGINYYIKEEKHYAHILYYSDDDMIHDLQTSFLFVNRLPKGLYDHYIYIETDKDIKNVISRLQNQLLTTADHNIYHFLSNITPDNQSISEIMKLASHTINNPIALCTPVYEIIEMCDNDIVFYDAIWNETLQTGTCSQKLVEQFESKGITEKVNSGEEPVLWSSDIENTYPQITAKIMYKNDLIAYLSVYVVNSDYIGEAFTIVKELIPILSSILSKSSHYVSDRYQMVNNFVYQLLENNIENIYAEAEQLDIHISEYRIVCISDKTNSSIYNYSYYLNVLLSENIIGSFYKGKLLLLIEEQSFIYQYIENLRNQYFSKRYVFFVSEILYDLNELGKTANMLLHFTNHIFPDQDIVYTNDYLHILYVPIRSLYSPAYERLSEPLHAELKDTLITYIEYNYNVSDASKALYIHRNTLLYRLSKIRTLFGINTNDHLELTNLYIYHKSLAV